VHGQHQRVVGAELEAARELVLLVRFRRDEQRHAVERRLGAELRAAPRTRARAAAQAEHDQRRLELRRGLRGGRRPRRDPQLELALRERSGEGARTSAAVVDDQDSRHSPAVPRKRGCAPLATGSASREVR